MKNSVKPNPLFSHCTAEEGSTEMGLRWMS
jgi:hypothetical protein